ARPGGAGWLDGHRYACTALEQLNRAGASRAVRSLLTSALRDCPVWPDCELDDGTPSANSETRAWVKREFGPALEGQPSAPPPARPVEPENRDVWDQAQELFERGQGPRALSLVAQAAREAHTGRDRFLRTLQQAELCLMLQKPAIAEPLLDGLARQVEERHLEVWEDGALCARVYAALYPCVRTSNPERAADIYQRLCRLDISRALAIGDSPEA
ncbi:MAG TPA: type VI secretion system domain-containing protein, partial [Isosphaeraceae bacterium]|nr:type VI secretion system domain-containing protein [Isosphaeraceae bacterium]